LTQKDAAGNTVEVYCLSPSGKHGSMFHSYYTDKATGKKYFIGGCFFDGGQNTRSKEKFTGASAPNLMVSSNLTQLGRWELSFTVPSFGGTGTQDDPFIGSPARIAAGDSLTISGASLSKAYVSGSAADPANGGWTVKSFSPSEVTFVATQDAEAWPGRPVGGLVIETTYTGVGSVPWSAVGDAIRYDGFVNGPGPVSPSPDPTPVSKTPAP
jgi:hypothetical protein